MQYEEMFKETMSKSRQLGPTNFVMEFLTIDDADRNFFQENADFRNDLWCIAPNGGAILMAHKSLANETTGLIESLHVYDTTGILLREIPILNKKIDATPDTPEIPEFQETIFKIHITPEECILCIFRNGVIRTYNLRGDLLTSCNMSQKFNQGRPFTVMCVAFWARGFFITDPMSNVYMCDDLANLEPVLYAKHGGAMISGGAAIPASSETSLGAMMFAYDSDGNIVIVQKDETQTIQFYYPVTDIVFSPSYTFVALRCESYYFFCDIELKEIYLNMAFDDIDPRHLVWCGNDTLLLIVNMTVAMLGAAETVIHWEMETAVGAVTEVDGARIITKNGVYLLRAIDDAPLDFALWNVKSPPVRLFTMMLNKKDLALKDAVNDFTLDELQVALDGCLDAAMFFTRFEQRLALMKVIANTTIMIQKPKEDGSEESEKLIQLRDFDRIADRLSTLRVCEQLFHQPYMIPMTFAQFTDITSSVLLKRLCNRSLHLEALKIANFLRVDTEFIAAHWSNCLIRTNPDILCPEKVLEKLKNMELPIDLIDLATTAFEVNRDKIAILLLDYNKAKARGVPLLIKRGKWKEALSFAVSSNDTSLMLYAFEEAQKAGEIPQKKLKKVLDKNSTARDVWIKFITGEQQLELLKLSHREPPVQLRQMLWAKEGVDDYLKYLRKRGDYFYRDMFNYFKALEELKKWIRDFKSGKVKEDNKKDDKKEGTSSGLSAAFSIFKKKKDDEEDNEDEDEGKNNKKGKKADKKKKPVKKKGKKKKGDSDDEDEDDDDGDEDESEEESDKKSKKKKGKKETKKKGKKEESEDEDEEEEKKDKKKKKKGDEEKEDEEEKPKEGEEAKPEGEEGEKKEEEKAAEEEKPAESPAEAPPAEVPAEEPPAEAAAGEAPLLGEEDKKEEKPPGPPPPIDELDTMTPMELYHRVVLTRNLKKIKEVTKLLDLNAEEALWARFFAGLKNNQMPPLSDIFKEYKAQEVMPLVQFCQKQKLQIAIQYLRGQDPETVAARKAANKKKK